MICQWLRRRLFREERDVKSEVVERDELVAEKIAEKLQVDARRKLVLFRGNLLVTEKAREEMELASRVKRGEEDWLEAVDRGQGRRMYGLWRRT